MAKPVSKVAKVSTTSRTSSRTAKPVPPTRDPSIEWVKNPDWTWKLVAYLSDHTVFRHKLFSDSTATASKENRVKSVGKDGKQQQFAVLARHIFEDDPTQAAFYKEKPARFATGVETRLRHLKKEYQDHLKALGQTGAGLASEMVTPGSNLDNLVATIIDVWPWWKEFHSFWRELPNYNPVGITTSVPGADHAADTAALFEGTTDNDTFSSEGGGYETTEPGDVEGADEDVSGIQDIEHDVDYETAVNAMYHQARESVSPSPPPSAAKPSADLKPPAAPKAGKALQGRDSGLAKAQSAASASHHSMSSNHKSALKDLQEARETESERMARKREMAHELAMENARNKRLKYELKYSTQQKTAAAENQARIEELKLKVELAKYEAAARQGTSVSGDTGGGPFGAGKFNGDFGLGVDLSSLPDSSSSFGAFSG